MAFKQQRLPGKPSYTVKGGQIFVGKRRIGFIRCLSQAYDFNLAFITPRKPEHFFRNYQGWGLNAEVVRYLKRHKICNIVIKVTGKKPLLSKVDDWLLRACNYQKDPHEPQMILPEQLMTEAPGCLQ